MEKYRCYYCNSGVFCTGSKMPDEIHYNVSSHCHIINQMLCTNIDCQAEHIEETDIDNNLIFFGPLETEEGL
ncbi:MAG: hypothetical protein ACLVIU_00110 [Paraclostridium sp.]